MLKIVFPGDPVAQQRCRIFKRGNRVCSFDPQVRVKYSLKNLAKDQVEEYLRIAAMWEHSGLKEPAHEAIKKIWEYPTYPRVSAWFYMPIPKSFSKKDRALAESETLKHDKKPDVDNLLKLYLDVLTGVVIKDDNAVHLGPCRKLYSPNPRTILFIQETGRIATQQEIYGS